MNWDNAVLSTDNPTFYRNHIIYANTTYQLTDVAFRNNTQLVCCSKFCHCALDGETRQELRPVQLQYYEALKQLIEESGRYDQKDDFSVVLQPFMRDWLPPKDVSLFLQRIYTVTVLWKRSVTVARANGFTCSQINLICYISSYRYQYVLS